MTDERLDIRPGVAAILRDRDGRILLHRRRAGGGWAPLSGTMEPGEAVLDALHREIAEETALTVEVDRFVGVYSDPATQIVHYPDGRRVQFVTCLFVCRPVGGTFSGSSEGLDWDWFAPARLPEPLTPYAQIWLADGLRSTAAPVLR